MYATDRNILWWPGLKKITGGASSLKREKSITGIEIHMVAGCYHDSCILQPLILG